MKKSKVRKYILKSIAKIQRFKFRDFKSPYKLIITEYEDNFIIIVGRMSLKKYKSEFKTDLSMDENKFDEYAIKECIGVSSLLEYEIGEKITAKNVRIGDKISNLNAIVDNNLIVEAVVMVSNNYYQIENSTKDFNVINLIKC